MLFVVTVGRVHDDVMRSVPPLAHPDRFADHHRVASSAELAELTRKAAARGCCSSPSLLIVTNAPCLFAGFVHGAMGRAVPAVIFCALAVASCFFHYFCDLRLRPSVFWARCASSLPRRATDAHTFFPPRRTDRALAYTGMAYHLWLFLAVRSLSAVAAGAVCIGSVALYNAAFAAWERGRVDDYTRLHSLWHVAAGVGTVYFALLDHA